MTHDRIFHLALAHDWQAAHVAGEYAEEGFIHASRADQWAGVRERFYSDVTEPLVLLVIEHARLDAEVRDEAVPGMDETVPHVYGPINLDAVVEARVLRG
jgi:uncharacterized protein (DUF952 family)